MTRRGLYLRLCGCAVLLACVSAVTFVCVRALDAPAVGRTLWTAVQNWKEDRRWQYTKSDLELLQSLHTGDYQARSVAEFDKALADWTDEDLFHSREEALNRLDRTYEADGEYAQFLARTLTASMGEASTRHYGGYCTRRRDAFWDGAVRERQEDVFGDLYTVFCAQAEYQVCYTILDEAALTVGERDRILSAYREELDAFLAGLSELQLLDEAAMEKKLERQLKVLDGKLSTQQMKLEGSSLAYYSAYGPEGV